MAETPKTRLSFDQGCPDCGERRADLPPPFPGVEDDFDWQARDFDSFRLFLMEELAARSPQRKRWTPADMEVVIVELLAAALDRSSHALDTIQQERFLETARRPESIRRLLSFIGFDAAAEEGLERDPSETRKEYDLRVEEIWHSDPEKMEKARIEGPRSISRQTRMVTLADHEQTLKSHPLVVLAQARSSWTGSWATIIISTLLEKKGWHLDDILMAPETVKKKGRAVLKTKEWEALKDFHKTRGLIKPLEDDKLSIRQALRFLVDKYRMVGSEVFLEDANEVGITFQMSVRVEDNFYRSEVRHSLEAAFLSDEGGFFEPGRIAFGGDIFASDLIEAAMRVEGVKTVCLNRLKRVGNRYSDRTVEGFIVIDDDEVAICENLSRKPERGYFRLVFHGGLEA